MLKKNSYQFVFGDKKSFDVTSLVLIWHLYLIQHSKYILLLSHWWASKAEHQHSFIVLSRPKIYTGIRCCECIQLTRNRHYCKTQGPELKLRHCAKNICILVSCSCIRYQKLIHKDHILKQRFPEIAYSQKKPQTSWEISAIPNLVSTTFGINAQQKDVVSSDYGVTPRHTLKPGSACPAVSPLIVLWPSPHPACLR